jgi:hypothetical protein
MLLFPTSSLFIIIAGLTREKGDGDWCTGSDSIISLLSDLYQRLALVKIKET